jgi:hypothetical protein
MSAQTEPQAVHRMYQRFAEVQGIEHANQLLSLQTPYGNKFRIYAHRIVNDEYLFLLLEDVIEVDGEEVDFSTRSPQFQISQSQGVAHEQAPQASEASQVERAETDSGYPASQAQLPKIESPASQGQATG